MRRVSRMVALGRCFTAGTAAVTLAAALCAVASASVAAPAGVVAGSDSGGTPVGAPPAMPIGAHDRGLAASTESVAFDVVLAPRNQTAVDAFVAAVSTPGSPSYQQFLAPGEFASRFGPTPATIARVTDGLRALGLTVGEPRGSVVPVSGTVSTITAALHTPFRHYALASGRIVRANDVAPRLPPTFAAAVQGIVGLDDLAQFRHPAPPTAPDLTAASTADPALDPAVQPAVVPNLTGPSACSAASTGSGTAFFTAPQLASYYGLTSTYTAGTRGAGIRVAVFELEPFLDSDINAYKTCYGISTVVARSNIDGGPGVGAGSAEAALDIEDIIGLVPDAGLGLGADPGLGLPANTGVQVYQGPANANGQNVLDVYNQIAVDDSSQVVSTSWGACEASSNTVFTNGERAIFQMMATQGQTIFAASGDAGSADCDTNPVPNPAPNTPTTLAVDDPASQPEVTGVGGSSLASVTGPETVWNDGIQSNGGGFNVSAGGGGVSSRWQMPSWQSAPGVVSPQSSGTPCSAPTGVLCREVPDVSASADPQHGYRIFFSGSWFVVGGTSASAPTWAAFIGLVDSRCGQRVGFVNPTLYQLRTAGTTNFHDVTSGNNDGAGANGGLYTAATGYDMASGLGTPIGSTLATALCPTPPPGDGKGTMTVAPANVGAATHDTLVFTYLPPPGKDFINGVLKIVVPAGWSGPSTTPGSAGFTTSSAGVVSIVGSAISVTGVSAAVNGAVTITYGDTSGGGPGTLAPSSAQTSTFTASQQATSSSTLTALVAGSPQVVVGTAADGTGTLTVSPTTTTVGAPTTLQFVYSPPSGTGITNGKLWITVPASWTTPQLGSNAAAGFVSTTTGTLSVSGQVIRVNSLTLAIGASVTVTYGDVSTNSAGAAVAPSTSGTSIFAASLQATAAGTLTPLAAPPSVVVNPSGGGGGGGGGGGPPPPPPLNLVRVAGIDRIGTSVAAAQTAFPGAGSAAAVIIVRSDGFADALAGTPLAVAKHGPMLLTAPAALDPTVGTEIRRVLAPGGTVYLLGGPAALSQAVAVAVSALGFTIVRIAGLDRFATATSVASMFGPPTAIFEADGTTFADALSAGTAAAAAHGVVVLTNGTAVSPVTASFLAANAAAKRYAIGGPAATADRSATPFVGADRFATAVLVAQAFFPSPKAVGLASGVAFPDALAGGAVAGAAQGPIVLVPASGALPASVVGYLSTAAGSATAAWLFGGTTAIAPQVFDQAAAILSGS